VCVCCVCVVRWFKHITDAAEAYRVKDGGRGRKPPAGLSQTVSDGSLSSSAAAAALDTSSSSVDVTSPVTPSSYL